MAINLRKKITEAKKALKQIMQDNLSAIGVEMARQVVSNFKDLPESKVYDALNSISTVGINAYKDQLKTAMSVVAGEGIKTARAQVPKAKKVKLDEDLESIQLGEFEKLPKKLQDMITTQMQLTVSTQVADLEKSIFFQYMSDAPVLDSPDQLEKSLHEAIDEYISGTNVEGSASYLSSEIIAQSRLSFFNDDEVMQEIDAFEFVNGDPVSEVCQDLAGTIFDLSDPISAQYIPPLHFNCKSYIQPILKGKLGNKEIETLKPSSTKIENTIQFAECRCK